MSLKEEETHTHSHTLSHTHRSGLKGEAALSEAGNLKDPRKFLFHVHKGKNSAVRGQHFKMQNAAEQL